MSLSFHLSKSLKMRAMAECSERSIHHCAPRLGSDFIATARGLLTDVIRSDLKNLKGFRFKAHPSILLEAERLDRLNTIVQFQLDKILA